MREIKFRAWIISECDDNDDPIYRMCYDLAFEEYAPINDLLKQVENLMQYTGLKDKNGKEIYEGDINQDLGVMLWNQDHASFMWEYPNEDLHGCSEEKEWCEIIGNIYENPELIKQ